VVLNQPDETGQPWNYKFGQKWYEIDVGRYVVEFLHLIGLAQIKNLKDLDKTNRLTRET
jgi:fatty-acid desaturase